VPVVSSVSGIKKCENDVNKTMGSGPIEILMIILMGKVGFLAKRYQLTLTLLIFFL
jgi:hypothetical protein